MPEFRPTVVALLKRNDFLGFIEWEGKSQGLGIGQIFITGKLADSPSHGVVPLSVPPNQELGLFFKVFKTHAHTSSLQSVGGHCPFGNNICRGVLSATLPDYPIPFSIGNESGPLQTATGLRPGGRELGQAKPGPDDSPLTAYGRSIRHNRHHFLDD